MEPTPQQNTHRNLYWRINEAINNGQTRLATSLARAPLQVLRQAPKLRTDYFRNSGVT